MAPPPPPPPALARHRRPPSGRYLIALGVRLLAQDRALAAQRRDELNVNLREVVAILPEDGETVLEAECVGIQTVRVA